MSARRASPIARFVAGRQDTSKRHLRVRSRDEPPSAAASAAADVPVQEKRFVDDIFGPDGHHGEGKAMFDGESTLDEVGRRLRERLISAVG